jgi:hypothetical protein
MNTAEIVIGKMQSDSGFQMGQFLAISQRQARNALDCLPHGQVLPFDKTCRDMLRIGIAHSHLGYNPRDAWWRVPRFGGIELAIVTKHFRKLCEMRICPKRFGNALAVVEGRTNPFLTPLSPPVKLALCQPTPNNHQKKGSSCEQKPAIN